jgi:dsDNA-binding SOS-regulon protein
MDWLILIPVILIVIILIYAFTRRSPVVATCKEYYPEELLTVAQPLTFPMDNLLVPMQPYPLQYFLEFPASQIVYPNNALVYPTEPLLLPATDMLENLTLPMENLEIPSERILTPTTPIPPTYYEYPGTQYVPGQYTYRASSNDRTGCMNQCNADQSEEKIIHLCKDKEMADLVFSKIMEKSAGKYKPPFNTNKIQKELKILEKAWDDMIVQDKRTDDYQKLLDTRKRLKEALQKNQEYAYQQERKREAFLDFLERKYAERPKYFRIYVGDPISIIDHDKLNESNIITLDYDDPDKFIGTQES